MAMTDENSNSIVLHDQGRGSWSFEDTLVFVLRNHTPASGSEILLFGDETQVATTMAMASHTLKSYNVGLSSKYIAVGLDDSSCDANSAHFPSVTNPSSNGAITSGTHAISITSCADSNTSPPPGARRKFTIAHEMGHAQLALFYGKKTGAQDGYEPFEAFNYNAAAHTTPCLSSSNSYGIDSAEWSSIGFREGFAHFVAARVFNDKATSGNFQWFTVNHSLETGSGVVGAGGRLEDVCCPSCTSSQLFGAATIGDWMRWAWDIHTNTWTCCGHNLTKREMYRLYAEARLEAESGGYNQGTVFQAVVNSMHLTGANACLVDSSATACTSPRVEDAGSFNGIDN